MKIARFNTPHCTKSLMKNFIFWAVPEWCQNIRNVAGYTDCNSDLEGDRLKSCFEKLSKNHNETAEMESFISKVTSLDM